MDRCGTCIFWNLSTTRDNPMDGTVELHPCHAHSPGFDSRTGIAVWPATDEYEWCGDHKLRPDEDK